MSQNFLSVVNLMASSEESARAEWIVESFPIIKIVLACLICVCAIFLIVASLCQKSEAEGGTNAITGQADTFYNRNKSGSLQGKIKKWTIAISITILVLCVAFLVINSIYEGTI